MYFQVELMGAVWTNDLASWNLNYSPPTFPVCSWQLAPPHPFPLANTFKGECCFSDGSYLLFWSNMRVEELSFTLFLVCKLSIQPQRAGTIQQSHRFQVHVTKNQGEQVVDWRTHYHAVVSLILRDTENWTLESSGRVRETGSPGKVSLLLFCHTNAFVFYSV